MTPKHVLGAVTLVLLVAASSGCDKLKGLAGGKEAPSAEPKSKPGTGQGAVADIPAPAAAGDEYKKGDRISVEWQGSVYPATILAVNGKFFFIHYDGWGSEWDETITKGRIRGRR